MGLSGDNMRAIMIFLLLVIFSTSLAAQQSQTITQLQNEDYKFAKGAIVAELADTVTPGFVQYHFKRLGYEIIQLEIAPLYGRIPKKLNQDQINNLLYHPYIKQIDNLQREFDEEQFLTYIKEKNLSAEDSLRHRNMLIRITENAGYMIIFEDHVTSEMAKTFGSTQSELDINVLQRPPNSVIIKTEPGKEQATMDELELLVYVTNTAMITNQNYEK